MNNRNRRGIACRLSIIFLILSTAAFGSVYAGEYDAQIEKQQKIVSRDPANLDAAYLLGNYLAWDERYDEALGVFEGILEKKPGYEDAAIGVAQVYAWKGDQDAAVAKYDEILAKNPRCFRAYQGLGQLFLWSSNFEESISYFNKALILNPEDVDSLNGIARAYLGKGDRRRADEYFTRAEVIEAKHASLVFLALCAAGIGAIAAGVVMLFRRRKKRQKEALLVLELKALRLALALYNQITGKFPLAAEMLLRETWKPPRGSGEKPYLENMRLDDFGFLIDPFGNRYRYNPDAGEIHSTMKGCEER